MFKKLLKSVLALVLLTALASDPATAQDLILGTTGKVVNAGTISFKSADAKFTNNNPAVAIGDVYEGEDGIISFDAEITVGDAMFDGTGTPLATTEPFRLPGTLRFNSDVAVTQNVQDNLYIHHLVVDGDGGSTVVFPPNERIYVSGDYTLGTAPVAVRDYTNNTFVYDGNNGSSQDILTLETYNNIELTGDDTKILPSVATNADIDDDNEITSTVVNGTFDVLATQIANVHINNQLTLNDAGFIRDGAAEFIIGDDSMPNLWGRLIIGAGGDFTVEENATMTVHKGYVRVTDDNADLVVDGTFALADEALAQIRLDAGADMIVNNSFTNAFDDRTNMNFNLTSSVTYSSADEQTMVSTVDTNPYGNLLTEGAGRKITNGDIHIANSLDVADANIDMYNDNDENYTLHITNDAATVTYAANEEVIGRFSHSYAPTVGSRTFNNAETVVTFADVTNPGTEFVVSSRPGVAPVNYEAETDLNRKVTLFYGGNDITWQMRMGYQETDVTSANWDPSYTESQLRMYESEDKAEPNVEKMSTGNAYDRDDAGAGSLGFVELAGFENGTDDVDGTPDRNFKSGNDLVFRAGPSEFITMRAGRWSKPETWDEGVMPGPDDFARIKHTVHMGYQRGIDDNFGDDGLTGGTNTEGERLATLYNGATLAAGFISRITIDTDADASLLVGNGAADNATTLFVKDITDNTASGEFVMNNANLTLPATVDGTNGDVNSALFNGFYVLRPNVTFAIKKNLTSEGNIGNAGTIEIGE